MADPHDRRDHLAGWALAALGLLVLCGAIGAIVYFAMLGMAA